MKNRNLQIERAHSVLSTINKNDLYKGMSLKNRENFLKLSKTEGEKKLYHIQGIRYQYDFE